MFTGYERDNETNLDYAKARFFESVVGRFSSPDDFANDSIAYDPQSWNLYVYVRNNPFKYVDPTGKTPDVSITVDEKKKRGVIRVSATIGIWSKDSGVSQTALENAAAQIKARIEGAWKGTVRKNGITYTVVTDVTVTTHANEKDAIDAGSQNTVEMLNGPVSNGADSEAGRASLFTSRDAGRWNINSMSGIVPAHEFGHFLGVGNKDGYNLMNGTIGEQHPTMTAEDFDFTFGSEVTKQRYNSQFVREKVWHGNVQTNTLRNTGKPQDSSRRYIFSAPRFSWWKSH